MTSNDCRLGFRIVGGCHGERRLVDFARAFNAYAACDPRAGVDREAYLSAFTFGAEFRQLLEQSGSPKGYNGSCGAPWLWFDIDRDGDLEAATKDARALCATLSERYALQGDELLIFFSGSKGYHVGLPTSLWQPEPSADFHRVARIFAEQRAAESKAVIDSGVYDRVRAFRAPNSRHPKTGLHKRRFEFQELLHLKPEAIASHASTPEPFDVPKPPPQCPTAVADWQAAGDAFQRQHEAHEERRAICGATLNRQTLEFIRDGAGVGDRHRLLFSAAANLAEFGCTMELAVALLTEAGLDSGLPPKEVRRQIECGLSGSTAGSDFP